MLAYTGFFACFLTKNTGIFPCFTLRCAMDNTYWPISSGSQSLARFSFQAFQFLRATDSVYIQCKVLICPASDGNSRCRRGCSRRAARDLGSEHDSQTLVVGPIKLKGRYALKRNFEINIVENFLSWIKLNL